MITKKTVFILGAGASNPFKLPLGRELLINVSESLKYEPKKQKITHSDYPFSNGRRIRNIDNDKLSSNRLFQFLLDLGYEKKFIEAFRIDLVKSEMNSVDAFLEFRTNYIEIGKVAIAYNLLRLESEKNLYSNTDWYKYIWNKMNSDYEVFQENKVAFITYNYDRTLEYYLTNCMSSLYGKDIHECFNKLKAIPIIHLHGKLGELPYNGETTDIAFGEKLDDMTKLRSIANSIKIIHEDSQISQEFIKAIKLLREANRICMLGFGFHQKNIDRLELKNLNTIIQASAYKINSTDRKTIMRKNPTIILSATDSYDCLGFLENVFEIE